MESCWGAQLLGASSIIFGMDQQERVHKKGDYFYEIRKELIKKGGGTQGKMFWSTRILSHRILSKTNSSFDLVFHLTSKYDLEGERGHRNQKEKDFL